MSNSSLHIVSQQHVRVLLSSTFTLSFRAEDVDPIQKMQELLEVYPEVVLVTVSPCLTSLPIFTRESRTNRAGAETIATADSGLKFKKHG